MLIELIWDQSISTDDAPQRKRTESTPGRVTMPPSHPCLILHPFLELLLYEELNQQRAKKVCPYAVIVRRRKRLYGGGMGKEGCFVTPVVSL
jgi:hypothetical protein